MEKRLAMAYAVPHFNKKKSAGMTATREWKESNRKKVMEKEKEKKKHPIKS